MSRKVGTICMVLGAALVLAALSLFLWNRQEASAADAAAADALAQVDAYIATNESAASDPYSIEMTEVEIDGHSYIGYLSLPIENLELPVMSDWSYPKLRTSPCRYTGSAYSGDLIVAGHNYSRHFGRLRQLEAGDEVRFTDVEGNVFLYQVSAVETLGKYAVDEMKSGGWDLTLFTCTYGGASRVTVRCACTGVLPAAA